MEGGEENGIELIVEGCAACVGWSNCESFILRYLCLTIEPHLCKVVFSVLKEHLLQVIKSSREREAAKDGELKSVYNLLCEFAELFRDSEEKRRTAISALALLHHESECRWQPLQD